MATSKSLWTKNFIILFICNALLFMSYNMQVPVLPLYGKKLGMDAAQIGLFVGALMFAGLIVRFFSGRLLKYFSKKLLLIVGVGLYLLTSIGYPLLTPFAFLIMLRVINGLGHGLATTYFATAAADELPMNHLGQGMGMFGVSSMLTASLAPLIAIPLVEHFSFNAFFIFCVIILAIATMLLIFFSPSSTQVNVHQAQSLWAGFDRNFIPHDILMMFLGIITSGVLSYITLFTQKVGIAGVAWFFFASSVVGVLMRPSMGRLLDQRGPFFTMIPSIICMIISLILIILVNSTVMLIIAGIFFGAADGAIFPTLQSWVLKDAPIDRRESITGVFLNCYDLGMGLGSYLMGIIIDWTSYTVMFSVLTGLTVIYLLISVAFKYRLKTFSNL